MAGKNEESNNPSGIQRLWAPWRMEYIQGQSKPGAEQEATAKECPFCTLPREAPSSDNLVLFADEDIFVVMNRFPYNPSHLLVIPRSHAGDPALVSQEIWTKLSKTLQACIEILTESSKPQGFNVGMNIGAVGGAGIPDHLHWHIVPRWAGDTNFMPILAETKALPLHNRSVWETLRPKFIDFHKVF